MELLKHIVFVHHQGDGVVHFGGNQTAATLTARCIVVVQACMLHRLIFMTILSLSHQAHIRTLWEFDGVSAFVQSGELIHACTA